MNTVLDIAVLDNNSSSLGSFIKSASYLPGVDLNTVYVKDQEGNIIDHVYIEEETLTDGSKVYNMVLVKGMG